MDKNVHMDFFEVTPILAAGGNPNYLACCTSNKLTNIDNRDFDPRSPAAARGVPATCAGGNHSFRDGLRESQGGLRDARDTSGIG